MESRFPSTAPQPPSAPWRLPNIVPLTQKPRTPLTELDENQRSIAVPMESEGKDAPDAHNICLQQRSSIQLSVETRFPSTAPQPRALWQLRDIVPLPKKPYTPLAELDGNQPSMAVPIESKSRDTSPRRNDEERSIASAPTRFQDNSVSAATSNDPTRIEIQPPYFPVIVCPEITCSFCALSTKKVLLHIGKEHQILSYSYNIPRTHQYCPYCWRVFLREDTNGIEEHCEQDHNVASRCPICERSFSSMHKLASHFEVDDLNKLRRGPLEALSWSVNGPWKPRCATCLLPFDIMSLQTHIQSIGHYSLAPISVAYSRYLAVVLLETWGVYWRILAQQLSGQ